MPAHIKVGGVWTEADKLHVRVGGSWLEVDKGWVKVAGVWTQFHASGPGVGTVLLDTTAHGAWSYTPDFDGNVLVELWGGKGGDVDNYFFNSSDGIYEYISTTPGGEGGYSYKTVAVTDGVGIGGVIGANGSNGINQSGLQGGYVFDGSPGGDTSMTSHHTAHGGGGASAAFNTPGTAGGQTGGDGGTTGGSFDGRVRITVAA